MQHRQLDKWGWFIYRCTYSDEEGWRHFKEIINRESRAYLAREGCDALELADSLEWTFVKDRETLEGATVEQLRARFVAGVPDAFKAEQPRAGTHIVYGLAGIPRYSYFIQVDEDAMRSVVYGPSEDAIWGEGYVRFVDALWSPVSENMSKADAQIDEGYEPIEGCTENVGWFKMSRSMVGVCLYEALSGRSPDVWYGFYQRPPAIVNW